MRRLQGHVRPAWPRLNQEVLPYLYISRSEGIKAWGGDPGPDRAGGLNEAQGNGRWSL